MYFLFNVEEIYNFKLMFQDKKGNFFETMSACPLISFYINISFNFEAKAFRLAPNLVYVGKYDLGKNFRGPKTLNYTFPLPTTITMLFYEKKPTYFTQTTR